MKRIIAVLILILLAFSCSSDADDNVIDGVWMLTEWNITDGFDINKDGIVNTNILNELACENKETLVFESTGVVSSNHTFNPSIVIALVNGTSSNYIFDVTCDDDEIISFATTFKVQGSLVLINDSIATANRNTLTRVFLDAIKIYNEDFTEVVATKDLTLVYKKQL